MANDYTTLADVKASFVDSTSYSGSTDNDAVFSAWITTASRLIDMEVGRWPGFFSPSTDDETRYYDGSGTSCQKIDEAVSITSVGVSDAGGLQSSDYDTWASSDYYVEPYNYSALGIPIQRIRADTQNGNETTFADYRKSVKVVGMFGWSSVCPAVIADAARIQAVRWFMRSKQSFMDTGAGVTMASINIKGQVELDPDVKALLYPFKMELMP